MSAHRLFLALLTALALGATSPEPRAQTATDSDMGVRLSLDDTVSPPTYRVSWWGRSGRHYLILRTEDLMEPWTPLPGLNPSGTDDVLTYVELLPEPDPADPDTAPKIFFRVVEFDPASPPPTGNALPDRWEEFYLGLTETDPAADADGDGLSNLQEYQSGLDPTSGDTDGDGMPDGWEVAHNFDPKSIEDAGLDSDHDGLINRQEFTAGANPNDKDTDGDGLTDGLEASLGSNPAHADLALDIHYVPEILSLPAGTSDATAQDISNSGILVGYANDYAARWIAKSAEKGLVSGTDYSYAHAVNDAGAAVGETRRDSAGNKALFWTAGSAPIRIGGSLRTYLGWDINNTGIAVGSDSTGGAFKRTADGSVGSLAPPSGYVTPEAYAINDVGIIVGRATQSGTGARRGVRWQNDIPSLLPAETIEGMDVNRAGDIVGKMIGGAFCIREGVLTMLPAPASGAVASSYQRINFSGMILAQSSGGTLLWHPTVGGGWQAPQFLTDRLLGPLERENFSAYGLNDHGELAGEYYDAASGAFLPVRFRPVLLPRLVADVDRDGTLRSDGTDDATASNPFRFWINDDDDHGDDKRSSADDIPLPVGSGARDSADTAVDGIRDLEDFFPVFLDIKSLLNALPITTGGISYRLRQDDGAIGVVFTNLSRTQALDYLRGAPAGLDTGYGRTLTQKAGEATVTKITAAGVDISSTGAPNASQAFFQRIRDNDGGVLLVEASKPTDKPLVLEVWRDSALVAEFKLELKIDPVETMFRYRNLRAQAHGTAITSTNHGPGFGSATATDAPNDPFAATANRRNLVFVHGYNVNADAARGSAATIFKRFYWSGSKANFYALLWRGDDGQGEGPAPAGATPDYHRNVGHAWQQGVLFRDFLESLAGETAIMAHSLGNLVAKVALTRARDAANPARLVLASKPATVKHYFAVDAAVPLEATSASEITAMSMARMRHSVWNGYAERLWSTNWHELFPNTDARSEFTWQNVFSGLEVGTNIYSSGEEVLANPLDDSTPVIEPVREDGLLSWVAQEKIKGGNSIAASLFRSATGGWNFNAAWYYNPTRTLSPGDFGYVEPRPLFSTEATEAAVPTTALPSEPFFRRFQATESGGFYPGYQGSRLHAAIGDTNADDEARKLVTFAKCLGEAIPVLSYAQGRNTSTKFDALDGNLDLNEAYNPATGTGFKTGWPASRGTDTNWKHSDCLNVCYVHHFKFYDHMAINGGLR